MKRKHAIVSIRCFNAYAYCSSLIKTLMTAMKQPPGLASSDNKVLSKNLGVRDEAVLLGCSAACGKKVRVTILGNEMIGC